jgi:ribosomal protein S18 acetylase RimI-like enzyme
MSGSIQKIGPDQYERYAAIPGWFWVNSVLHVEVLDGGMGGFKLAEIPVEPPYIRHKDDGLLDNPQYWAREFDLSKWGIFVFSDDDGNPSGGAAVAIDSQVYPIDRFQRRDLAVLWDIRVHPDHRGKGIGTRLFQHAASWARGKGCGQLGLETDSSNVRACRFYRRMGCQLGAIHRYGYIAVPEAAPYAMLLWYFDLEDDSTTRSQ